MKGPKYSNKYRFKSFFPRREFFLFLKKYRCLLLFRGKSSLSFKFFEKVLLAFKKKFKKAPYISISTAIRTIIPIFGFLKRKMGHRISSYPALITKRKRINILLKWLVRNFKNRIFFKTRGYDVNYLANIFVQATTNDGRASITADNYRESLIREKFNLRRKYTRKNPLMRKRSNILWLARKKKRELKKQRIQKFLALFDYMRHDFHKFLLKFKKFIPKDRFERRYFFRFIKMRIRNKKKFKYEMDSVIKDQQDYEKFLLFIIFKRIRTLSPKIKQKYLQWFTKKYKKIDSYKKQLLIDPYKKFSLAKDLKKKLNPKKKMDLKEKFNFFPNYKLNYNKYIYRRWRYGNKKKGRTN